MLAEDSQPELPLLDSEAPHISSEDVRALCVLLERAAGSGWLTAAELAEQGRHNFGYYGWNERRVRAIAEAADGAVLSWPGSPGYKLFDRATEAEYARCDSAWGSQIERMTSRRTAYRRRHHGRELVSRSGVGV